MDNEQKLLQISAKLFQQLESVPRSEERDKFIEEVNRQLNERGNVLEILHNEGFQIEPETKLHSMLIELDKGIRERLDIVMEAVKSDMKTLQKAKNKEKKYINPYDSVRTMDGRYYDKKK
ncbi:flagellar protein FliT [Ureibacillus acetophenoni]|uniref:Flagellar protein FliT n=1 Tax=Ureibacillus acetophenoni TaxID=614649 RepID=A0A285U3A0_9BACL|nr:flagellar protein FliT [Ureibacillus acetophenoni]SOC34976.1 flagellar protein FliT [Ureibacillus acetophenoni]